MNRGAIPVNTVDDYLDQLQTPRTSFPTLPPWITFFEDTFTLRSSQVTDNGFYLIFITAEIFNPGTGELIVNNDLMLEIKATIPFDRVLNIPPYFVDEKGNEMGKLPTYEFQVDQDKFLTDEKFEIQLPGTKDDKGSEVTIQIDVS